MEDRTKSTVRPWFARLGVAALLAGSLVACGGGDACGMVLRPPGPGGGSKGGSGSKSKSGTKSKGSKSGTKSKVHVDDDDCGEDDD